MCWTRWRPSRPGRRRRCGAASSRTGPSLWNSSGCGTPTEWELTLQLTLEALGFAVVNGAGRFTVTGPDGSARSFDLIRGGPAEKLFLKILFPLDKRE